MKALDFDPKVRWLFCMTHPDDELSVAAYIRRLTRVGAEVFMSWTHSTDEREAEARAAADLLGVPQDRLTFFDATDGHILSEIPNLLPKFADLIKEVRPNRVLCGAFEQGHLDHDSTNLLVGTTFDGPIIEVPFYHTYASAIQTVNRFADPSGEEILQLDSEEICFKERLLRQYPSQRIRDLLIWYSFWRGLTFRPAQLLSKERVRIQKPLDYRKPNLPDKLANRVSKTSHWRRWRDAIRDLSG